MPLPDDPQVVETGKELLGIFRGLAGPHPGFRPAHAKGLLVQGTFVPTAAAAALSRAPHFQQASTPVVARFSSSTGLPTLPDADPSGNPRGLGLRFVLAETPRRRHTDIVAQTVPRFPAATPAEALAFFRAVAAATADPAVGGPALGAYVAAHPAAQAFVAAPKPTPSSLARAAFYGINAFKLVSAAGAETYVRYRVLPLAGVDTLTDDAAAAAAQASPDFLYDGVRAQLRGDGGGGTTPLAFRLVAQVARAGADATDDCTVLWPDSGPDRREEVELGRITLDALFSASDADEAAAQKHIIFDPVPRVDGVEPSADPLIDLRAALYLLSGRERRAA